MATFPSRRRAKRPPSSPHAHSPSLCPAHVSGCCGCPDLENWLCNPYYVPGFCPDAIELMPGPSDPVPVAVT